jgi:hypothetical protein
MTANTKQTSKTVASLASHILHDPKASALGKSLAASALSQSHTAKQTGAEMEHLASLTLHDPHATHDEKTLAGSIVSQATKDRHAK